MAALERMSAAGGCEYIGTDAKTSEKYSAIVINEDAVFSVLAGGQSPSTSTNYMTTIGLTSKTIKAGIMICAPDGEHFASVTLTSGSAIGYKS